MRAGLAKGNGMCYNQNGKRKEAKEMDEARQKLFENQKALLDTFLSHGAITRAQYEKSLGDLRVKMGVDGASFSASAPVVRRAVRGDLPRVLDIYAAARERMRESGNPHQWGSSHPSEDMVREDIATGRCYLVMQAGKTAGVFFFDVGEDPTYRVIYGGAWPNDKPYGVIHRIAAAPGAHGVLAAAVAFAFERISELRIDTHSDNRAMQGALEKLGFRYCGTIFVADGTPRMAYAKSR